MAMPIVPQVDVNAATDRSCNNWLCCFGCCNSRKPQKIQKVEPETIDVTFSSTVEKIEVVAHHLHQSTEPIKQ